MPIILWTFGWCSPSPGEQSSLFFVVGLWWEIWVMNDLEYKPAFYSPFLLIYFIFLVAITDRALCRTWIWVPTWNLTGCVILYPNNLFCCILWLRFRINMPGNCPLLSHQWASTWSPLHTFIHPSLLLWYPIATYQYLNYWISIFHLFMYKDITVFIMKILVIEFYGCI